MIVFTEIFLLALYLLLLILGSVLPVFRLPSIITLLGCVGFAVFENSQSIIQYTLSAEGKHVFVYFFTTVVGLILHRPNLNNFFQFVFISLPLSFLLLVVDHSLLSYLSIMSLLLYVSTRKFYLPFENFRKLLGNVGFLVAILTIFAASTAIAFSSVDIGIGFTKFEYAGIVSLSTCLILYLGIMFFVSEPMILKDEEFSSELMVIAPAILFKLLIFLQSIFVLMEVEVQNVFYDIAIWFIGGAIILVGLASYFLRSLKQLSLCSFISLSLIVLLSIFIEPTAELHLPLYLIISLSCMALILSSSPVQRQSKTQRKWIGLHLSLLPLSATPFCLFIYLRVMLSDGLESLSFIILMGLILLVTSGIALVASRETYSNHDQTSLKLPIRTILLFSCTLLSTCLLVL